MLEVQNRAKETVQALYAKAAELRDDGARKKLVSFALASESAQRITAMLQLARSEVATLAESFDTDPDVLNFLNGTVHLPTGELQPHRREDRITKLLHFNYNQQAVCPHFLKFQSEIMAGNKGLCDYLQKVHGYSVTGHTSEKAAFVCHGSGDNGKTTLLATLREILKEYSVLMQVDSLMERRFESSNAQADLADLQGARFCMTSETEAGQRLSASRLKRITQGMGSIRAVRKYENPVSFPETHKLFLDCNHRPRVRDDGAAIWNRLHLIPFTVSIPKDQQDPSLHSKLLAEAEGILAFIVEGAQR